MTKQTKKAQINFRISTVLDSRYKERAGAREQRFADWIRDALDHWASLCEEAEKAGCTPHDIAALQHGDHVTVDALVGELQTIAKTRKLNDAELGLLQRLDPTLWRAMTGEVRR